MPLFLVEPETIACAGAGGCGAVSEVGPASLEPAYHAGELVGLTFRCACGLLMCAPRMSPEEAASALADASVAWGRRVWRRLRWAAERGLRLEAELERLPFADWPVPPGEHTLNLAALWARLELAGWPHATERGRRHADALERWPLAEE